MARGLLVLNLGTPDSPNTPDVKKYLAQFLMDPFVIDIPYALRWLLIHGIILRSRPQKSAEAYKKIWTREGSPLLFNTVNFANDLKEVTADAFSTVEVGMRYGNPSIESGLKNLLQKGATEIVVFSMYPQYAESSFRTGIDEVRAALARIPEGPKAKLTVVPPYYAHAGFIDASAELLGTYLNEASEGLPAGNRPFVLMSFHGLPQRHLSRLEIGPKKSCGREVSCCAEIKKNNADCYRAQSFETARQIAGRLDLPKEQWTISFQSRLGPGWIQPFTDVVLQELPDQGKKDLVVVCPSFTSDCLETLEEMGIRGRDLFMKAGGRSYTLVPCLNASPGWIQGAKQILNQARA